MVWSVAYEALHDQLKPDATLAEHTTMAMMPRPGRTVMALGTNSDT